MSHEHQIKLKLKNNLQAQVLYGMQDANLKLIEKTINAKIIARGDEIVISGDKEEVLKAEKVFYHLIELINSGQSISAIEINYALNVLNNEKENNQVERPSKSLTEPLLVNARGKQITPKTLGQFKYIEDIKKKDIVFGIGPAGTGKTYLAVVMAVRALRRKDVHKIVLTRPAVEAGEKLGFLPGDLQDKVDPYLRPLYDGLYDTLGMEIAQKYMEKGIIEVAPLAYMRGRTLEDSFVILDEAQNTTPEQMKMFLTRIGFGSKAVVTGDITQVDLPKNDKSGLIIVQDILMSIPEIGFQYLTSRDVVRHPVVAKIIEAYENYQSEIDERR